MTTEVDKFLEQFGVGSLVHRDEQPVVEELTDVDAFLAHYGVKGMRWGVRRVDGGTDFPSAHVKVSRGDIGADKRKLKSEVDVTVSRRGKVDVEGGKFLDRRAVKKQTEADVAAAKAAPPGTTGTFMKNGRPVLVQKNNKGDWEETYISEDASRFMKAHLKPQHELSNKELKAYLDRAEMMSKYDKLAWFNKKDGTSGVNQPLKDELDRLQTKQSIGRIKAEMRGPSKLQRIGAVAKHVERLSGPFSVFKKLDDMTGNAMSNEIKRSMKEAFNTKGDGPVRNAPSRSEKKSSKRKQSFTVNPDSVKVRPTPTYKITDLNDPGSDFNNPTLPDYYPALPRGSS